jgi:hypothetical protein
MVIVVWMFLMASEKRHLPTAIRSDGSDARRGLEAGR